MTTPTTIGRLLIDEALPPELRGHAQVLDKKGLQKLLQAVADTRPDQYRDITHKLIQLGADASYSSGGYSFGLKHLLPSPVALKHRRQVQQKVDALLGRTDLSDEDREKQISAVLTSAGGPMEKEMYEEALAGKSPLAHQILSGAKGSPGNLRSLSGGDLAYDDPSDRTIPVPVLRGYAEGLTPAQYFAAAFGARQGTVRLKLCLFEDTSVRMADWSTRKIKDVRPGDYVLGADEDGQTFPVRVHRVFDNGLRECWRYEFRVGTKKQHLTEIIATPDHKILAKLKLGRGVYKHLSVYEPTMMPLAKARKDFRAIPAGPYIGTDGVDEPRAEMMGLLLGNGNLSTGGPRSTLGFSCADKQLVAHLNADLGQYGMRLCKPNGYTYTVAQKTMAKQPRVGRRWVPGIVHPGKLWLASYGLLGKKSHEKKIPACVWTWNKQSVAALVSGLLATDGCVHVTKRNTAIVSFRSTSRQMVESLRALLRHYFGIYVWNVQYLAAESMQWGVHDQYVINIDSREGIQRLAAQVCIPGVKGPRLSNAMAAWPTPKKITDSGFSFHRKERLGMLPTFDLEVAHASHRFVLANGMVVSNSTQESGYLGKLLGQAAHRLVVTARDADKEHEPGRPIGVPVPVNDPDNEGAYLASAIGGYARNTHLTPRVLADLRANGHDHILVRSPIAGGPPDGGVYGMDVGVRERGGVSPVGDFVGIGAAQAVSEPLAQATICLAAGTEVVMADGSIKTIESIQPGEYVLGSDTTGRTSPAEVLQRFDNGLRSCNRYRLRTNRDTEIICTPQHKVLAEDAGSGEGHVVPVAHADYVWDHRYQTFTPVCDAGPVGEVPTYDLEIDHPDHLFVLKAGWVVSNSAKHTGGVAGATKGTTGYKLIEQLVQHPKTFAGGAAHAQLDGRVDKIEPAPQGGSYVSIDGQPHYVATGLDVHVKPGDRVEAGDSLSDGIPNPEEFVQHKGIGEGRRRFVEQFRQAARSAGFTPHRRNLEIIARGLINHVQLHEEMGDHSPDDVVPYHTLEHAYEPRPGHQQVSPKQAVGRYLERPVLHHTIGTKVRPSMLEDMARHGVQSLVVHNDPPIFSPVFARGSDSLSHDSDWFTRTLGSNLEKNILRGAHRADVSDPEGTSFVPGLARGLGFGTYGKTKGWDPKTITPG